MKSLLLPNRNFFIAFSNFNLSNAEKGTKEPGTNIFCMCFSDEKLSWNFAQRAGYRTLRLTMIIVQPDYHVYPYCSQLMTTLVQDN